MKELVETTTESTHTHKQTCILMQLFLEPYTTAFHHKMTSCTKSKAQNFRSGYLWICSKHKIVIC